jgi:O-antigen/teichoic acid export membrane protein
MAALRLSGQAFEFAGWALLARRLGTSAFGDLAVAFLLARYAGLIADWGASFRGARDVAAEGRHGSIGAFVRKRRRTAIVLAALAAIVTVALQRPGLAPMALVVLSLGLSRDWIAVGREQGARAGVPIAVQGVVILGSSFLASTSTAGAVAVGAGYAVAALMSVLLNRVDSESNADAFGSAHGWVLAAVLANQITSSTDTVLLRLLQSASAAGIYAAVYRIPNAWLAVLSLLLGSLLPMATSSLVDDRAAHDALRQRSLRVSLAGAVFILLLIPVSWLVTPALFGADYEPGRGPLAILMVATALITLAAPLHPFALSMGKDRPYALILVGGAVSNMLANLAVIPWLGMAGAAWTTLGAQAVVSVLLWNLVRSGRRTDSLSDRRDRTRSGPSARSRARPS